MIKDIKNKKEEESKIIIGKWYKNSPSNIGYAKAKSVLNDKGFDIKEIIDGKGKYKKMNSSWVYHKNMKEASLEEVSKYLPEGHPDKIVSDLVVGKWYKIDSGGLYWYYKFLHIDSDNCIISSEHICKDKHHFKGYGCFNIVDYYKRIPFDISEIQEFLPNDHPDKIKTTMKLEQGKWYKIKNGNWFYKYNHKYGEAYYSSETIDNTIYDKHIKKSSCMGRGEAGFEEVPLEDIQKYLPDGHEDKIVKEDVWFDLDKCYFATCWGDDYLFYSKDGGINNLTLLNIKSFAYIAGGAFDLTRLKNIRLSTSEEKDWLDACISAGKFVEEPLIDKPLTLGEWETKLKSLNMNLTDLKVYINTKLPFNIYVQLKFDSLHDKAENLIEKWRKEDEMGTTQKNVIKYTDFMGKPCKLNLHCSNLDSSTDTGSFNQIINENEEPFLLSKTIKELNILVL